MSSLTQFFGGGGGGATFPIELLLVGGGGAGYGAANPGLQNGGGGAGQVLFARTNVAIGISYNVNIGAGGASPTQTGGATFLGNMAAYGGGAGGGGPTATQPTLAFSTRAYGSAGGQTLPNVNSTSFSGDFTGMVPTGFAAQNNATRGGGAGAGALPTANPQPGRGSYGGNGIPMEVIGIPDIVGGGGGQGGSGPTSQAGNGGSGGGGDGRWNPQNPGSGNGEPGTANTGGGGGGAGPGANGGAGGSGLAIVRYPTAFPEATVTGNSPTPGQTGYRVYRFNSNGTITFNV